MVMRTPGRRIWEVRHAIRLGGLISISMLAISLWFLYGRVKMLESPHNPHYGTGDHCFDCHQGKQKHSAKVDCFVCHDDRTRGLRPGALAALMVRTKGKVGCLHAIKDSTAGAKRTVTALCLSCHKKVQGYVAMVDIASKSYVEIDMAMTHPIGLMPTKTIYPRTLPLSKGSGAIDCVTCHDQHATDKRLRMLRYYYPGNGHPADFRPLCLDCHSEGWLPLKMRPGVVKGTGHHE